MLNMVPQLIVHSANIDYEKIEACMHVTMHTACTVPPIMESS